LHRLHFPADPVTAFLARPDVWLAALNTGHFGVKLFRSVDEGENWNEVAAPAYPPQPDPAAKPAWKLFQIWTIEAGPDGSLWAGTLPGGLFRSRDLGQSWSFVDALWNVPQRSQWAGGGYDMPGIHSLCFDPARPQAVLAAISCGGLWHSEDSGETWTQEARGLKARYMPPELQEDPVMQDPHRVVQCPAAPSRLWCQHHSGVFQSHDFGLTWTEPTQSPFGFAVAVHPQDPDTAWFVPAVADVRRLPAGESLHVLRTKDGGKTFQELRKGLPQEACFDLVYRHCLAVDGSGRELAFASTTGNFWASEDAGERWTLVNGHLPPVYQVTFA
jgi:photosystem II stability/assembly factor-like uncharacterized protein